MPAGLIVPGDSRPGGALSGVATQSKHGQQDLKVVPTPKARPGFEIDTSNLNKSLRCFLQSVSITSAAGVLNNTECLKENLSQK